MDPSGFKKGAQQAADSQAKLKRDISGLEDQIASVRRKSTAATKVQDDTQLKALRDVLTQKKKNLRETEAGDKEQLKRGKDQAAMLGTIKNAAVELFAVFTAGQGIKSFVQDLIVGDAAMGRFADNVGVSAQAITAFDAVVQSITPGSKGQGAASIGAMADMYRNLVLKGQAPAHGALSRLGLEGGTPVSEGDFEDPMVGLGKLNQNAQNIPKPRFSFLARQIPGMNQATINLLELSTAEYKKQIAAATEREHLTQKEIDEDQALVTAIANIKDGFKGMGRDAIGAIMAMDFRPVLPVIAALREAFTTVGTALKSLNGSLAANIIGGALVGALNILVDTIHAVRDIILVVIDILTGQWGKALHDAGSFVGDFVKVFTDAFDTVKNAAEDMWYAITHHGQQRPRMSDIDSPSNNTLITSPLNTDPAALSAQWSNVAAQYAAIAKTPRNAHAGNVGAHAAMQAAMEWAGAAKIDAAGAADLSARWSKVAAEYAAQAKTARDPYADQVGAHSASLAAQQWSDRARQLASGGGNGSRAGGGSPAPGDFAARIEHQESGGRQFDRYGRPLTSPKGAVGVMQMLPDTARSAARLAGIPWDENAFRTNPDYNRRLGRAELARLMKKYGGDQALVASAYNAGEHRTDQWIKRFGDPRKGEISDAKFIARIPFAETRQYAQNTAGRSSGHSPRYAAIDPGLATGASATAASYSNDNSRSANSQTDVQINKIEVNVPAGTDVRGAGGAVGPAVKSSLLFTAATQANTGLA